MMLHSRPLSADGIILSVSGEVAEIFVIKPSKPPISGWIRQK